MNYRSKKIYIGNIVQVFFDDEPPKIARVVSIDQVSESAMVVYLNDFLEDEELATVSLLNIKKFEGKL